MPSTVRTNADFISVIEALYQPEPDMNTPNDVLAIALRDAKMFRAVQPVVTHSEVAARLTGHARNACILDDPGSQLDSCVLQ
jgi:hypothetical protein